MRKRQTSKYKELCKFVAKLKEERNLDEVNKYQ